MEPLLSLPADQFRAALAELQLDPQREADLVRQYRRANSPLAPIYGLLDRVAADDAGQGMQRASMAPVSRPEGMSVAEAVRSGEARLAIPQGVLDAIGGLLGGIDAPGAAARGLIPAQDMAGEALGTAGVAMGAGGLLSRPAGSVGMGGRVAADARASDWIDDLRSRYPGAQIDVSGGPGRGYTVSRIVVPEDARSQGLGTQIMREITDIADSQGATVSLTPSSDFGGNVSRLRNFYSRLGFVSNAGRNRDMSISEKMYREPISANRSTATGLLAASAETPAQRVAALLREGRASEVTDDLMAQVDPQEMYRLYVSGQTGMDLPMDEASRMARAREMGFDTNAFHATRSADDFQTFRPGVRGSTYLAATPEQAVRGATGQSLEFGGQGGGVRAVMPLTVNSRDVRGLGVNADAWAQLPERVVGDDAIRAVQPMIARTGAQYWDDVYEGAIFGDESRYFRNDPPAITYQDLEPGRDVFGYRLPGYNSGSDVPSLERVAQDGYRGFMVADEAGSSIVAGPDMPIRSRFARFDPRLSHLANLNAANVSPIAGLLAILQAQEQQR